jgi:hypothetical protein
MAAIAAASFFMAPPKQRYCHQKMAVRGAGMINPQIDLDRGQLATVQEFQSAISDRPLPAHISPKGLALW